MPLQVPCPNPACRQIFQVDESLTGRTGRCASCGQKFQLQPSSAVTRAPSRAATSGEQPDQVGRFQIRARLGSGAFGTVYRAHDPQLDRDIAL